MYIKQQFTGCFWNLQQRIGSSLMFKLKNLAHLTLSKFFNLLLLFWKISSLPLLNLCFEHIVSHRFWKYLFQLIRNNVCKLSQQCDNFAAHYKRDRERQELWCDHFLKMCFKNFAAHYKRDRERKELWCDHFLKMCFKNSESFKSRNNITIQRCSFILFNSVMSIAW